jgi:predicted phage tail protein
VPSPAHTPTGLTATSVAGNVVTLTWTAPTAVVATGYVLRGGLSPGEVAASLPTGSTATSLTAEAPTGVFYLRIHALVGGALTGPSNEIRVSVNVPTVPSAPVNLLAGGSGSSLFLAWQNTAGGGTPTAIRLDVSGALTGSAVLAAQETFSFDGVPPGTYTFAVSAVNSAGSSAPSSPVTLTFPATCAAPDVPAGLTASKSGALVTLSWNLPPAGAAPTGYRVVATGTHAGEGFTAARSLSAVAPPGTYTVTVAAVNPCGASAASAPVQITIP